MAVTLEQRYFLALLSGLIVAAWLVLWAWGQSPYAHLLSHDDLSALRHASGTYLLATLAGWLLMTVAMMLPTALPLIYLFRRLTQRRADRARLVLLLIGGYLGAWALFGYLAHLGFGLIHSAVKQNFWLYTHAWVISAGTFFVAGAYQFTSLKYACLDQCRSPLSFISAHWRGHGESYHSLRLGFVHGWFCIGCCWSLMLVMFVVGMNNLGWMLGLAAVMAIEKNTPWGQQLSAPVGVALIAWSLLLVAVNTGYLKLSVLPPIIGALCGPP